MKIVWMKYRKMKLKTREKKGKRVNERFEDRLRKGRKGKSGVEDSECQKLPINFILECLSCRYQKPVRQRVLKLFVVKSILKVNRNGLSKVYIREQSKRYIC